jgi:hypothetical protein
MKAVSSTDLRWQPYPGQRSPVTQYQALLRGSQGHPGNFEFYMVRYGEGGSYSPRHRHNFEQFRWAFDKPLNFAPDRDIPPGQLGYFPEGAFYGPQVNNEGTEMLIVQFGGPSAQGYVSLDSLAHGTAELKNKGEFNKGIYTYFDAEGRKFNKDGYEAVWEHVSGRPVKYCTPRFDAPVVINPEAFDWLPIKGTEGVRERKFGTFNERGTAAAQLKIDAGATFRAEHIAAERLLFVLSGKLQISNAIYSTKSSFRLFGQEELEATAIEETFLLMFTMPDFSDVK